jgi:hypothetical protein
MPNTPSGLLENFRILASDSPLQFALFGGAAATWLVGANTLVVHHYWRLGKSGWLVFSALDLPFGTFNSSEWRIFVAVGVVALMLLAIGLSVAPR